MLTQIKKDKLTLNVFETREEMGNSAGKLAGERINQVIKEKGMANVIFAAAPSQNETLKALCAQQVDWSKVRAFHMDEYLGLAENSPNLFARYLDENIFKKVPFAEIHYIGSNPAKSI
ncbi:MAG: glucosamine-6-phosphate deaminase, partial [Clostridia bacterium]|nr:glucosamine-6-phosphate deaminase [Clostridia bacterium]